MGLGALVCTPRNPDCARCPVSAFCRACENGTQLLRPVKPEKQAQKVMSVMVAVVYCADGLLMRKRGRGLLSGLWEYPCFEDARELPDLEAALSEAGIDAVRECALEQHRHVFTHRIWQMQGYAYQLRALDADSSFHLVSWAEFARLAVPAAFQPYTEFAREMAGKHHTD